MTGSMPDVVGTCVVLGVPVDDVTLDEAVDLIAGMVGRGRSTGSTHQVATVNVDFVVNALRNRDVLEILQRSDLSIPDGMPVVWASKVFGTPLRGRTTGIDLMPALASRAASDGLRIVLFGGAPGVAESAAELLRRDHPGVDIAAVDAPMVSGSGKFADDAAGATALDAIRACDPDVLCVALGNPKQERWITRYRADVGAPVAIGVGGSLDFLTGTTRRAPAWMQRSGLEWLHRAASEPQRLLGRYARDFRIYLPGVVGQAWRGRRRAQAIAPQVVVADDATVVRVGGPLPTSGPDVLGSQRLQEGGALLIDLAAAGPLDNATVSVLIGLVRSARRVGAFVEVKHVPRQVRPGGSSTGLRAMIGCP